MEDLGDLALSADDDTSKTAMNFTLCYPHFKSKAWFSYMFSFSFFLSDSFLCMYINI